MSENFYFGVGVTEGENRWQHSRGKLFDERGEGLTPSDAVKGKRRYRYYVSRSLIKGSAGQATNGWRVPAAELERIVATAIKTMLDDRQLIIAAIEQAPIDSSQTASLLETAAALRALS